VCVIDDCSHNRDEFVRLTSELCCFLGWTDCAGFVKAKSSVQKLWSHQPGDAADLIELLAELDDSTREPERAVANVLACLRRVTWLHADSNAWTVPSRFFRDSAVSDSHVAVFAFHSQFLMLNS
jgi:hypothetical protein